MSAIWSSLPVQENVSNGAAVMLVPLPGESVVTVTGPDSEKFLQGQTSTDFREVTPTTSRLGCYCNLKGRATVSFRAVLWQGSYHLSVDTELLALAKSTLQKYIIFSKAQLSTPDIALFGILGAEAANFIRQQFGVCIDGTDTVIDCGDFALVRLPGDNRFLALAKAEALPGLWEKLTATAPVGSANDWRLAQIRAGESQVLAAGSEQFQPQELNLQALKGVSYNKGCYTGQEIVARLYFRGRLKQWVHRFAVAADELPAINTPLVTDAGQTVGHVVMAAHAAPGQVELLAVVRHDALSGLHLPENPAGLQALDLPYVVEPRE
jgi:folate-binding protein YgfZ